MTKRVFVPLCAIALVLSLSLVTLADTIRLKDGSVIQGEVVGFKDQQFTVLIGGGARGRRSTLTLYMEDVESIEFEAGTSGATSEGSDDNATSGASTQPSTQSSTQLPRPTPSRPANQTSSTTQQPQNRPSTPSTTSRPASTQPVAVPIPVRVRGDNTANGWTNSGLSVRRGQHIRITATGQVSLGNGRFSQPSGISTLPDKDKLMADEATGALISVIGEDNNDFIFIGRARDFVAQRDGVLFLGVNEGNLNDNTGAYDAVIEAEALSGTR